AAADAAAEKETGPCSARLGRRAAALAAPAPPDEDPAPPAAHERDVDRQDDKAEGQHPQAKDREEAEDAADDQQYPEQNPQRLRQPQGEAMDPLDPLLDLLVDLL